MTWYQRFGLEHNPFSTDPFNAGYTLVNYSQLVDDLLYYTASGSMILLQGTSGSGKTMMLRQVIDRHKGYGKVAYIDGKSITKQIDVETILNRKGRGMIDTMLFKRKPSGMILLLDDIETISAKQFEKIKYYFDQDYIRTVIFTIHTTQQLDMPLSIRDRISGRNITIPPIISFDALRIIRDRFSDHFFLPDEIILEIFNMTQGNIKQMLQACDAVCSYVVEQGRGEVLPKYLKIAVKTLQHPLLLNA